MYSCMYTYVTIRKIFFKTHDEIQDTGKKKCLIFLQSSQKF